MKTSKVFHKDHPVLYLLPALIILATLVGYPLINNLVSSFQYDGVFPSVQNYANLFMDKIFRNDLKNTFTWLLYTVSLEMIIGLLIAVLLNMNIRFKKLFRTIFIIPWVTPAVVVCVVWKWIYNVDYGILNYLFKSVGIIAQNQLWLSDINTVLICIAIVYVWKLSPFVMIMYLSGLQTISNDIYEASRIDGAGWFRQLYSITIPLLFPIMRSVILISTIWSLNSFVYVYNMSRGGPARMSELVQIFVYKTGIEQFNTTYSATASIVFLLIVMMIAYVYIGTTEKYEA